MKKNILKVMIVMLSLFTFNVYAESYYTSENGIELTEFQYNTLVDMLSEERVSKLTEEDYESFHVERMVEGNFEHTTKEVETIEAPYPGGLIPYAFHETTSKKITLSKSCSSSYCHVATVIYWKKTPAVTSYDVLGVRLENSTFYDSTNAFISVMDGNYSASYDAVKKASNGLADIFKITSGIDHASLDLRINQTSNGMVFASYQHAVKDITLAKATNFTFKGTGYGSVFLWPTSYGQIYDQMAGVSITLY